jgi:hypothetical protein
MYSRIYPWLLTWLDYGEEDDDDDDDDDGEEFRRCRCELGTSPRQLPVG